MIELKFEEKEYYVICMHLAVKKYFSRYNAHLQISKLTERICERFGQRLQLIMLKNNWFEFNTEEGKIIYVG